MITMLQRFQMSLIRNLWRLAEGNTGDGLKPLKKSSKDSKNMV